MAVIGGVVFKKGDPTKPVPNARIVFTSVGQNRPFKTRSNQRGIYRLNVPAGTYLLAASADQFIKDSSATSRVKVGNNRQRLNIPMTPIGQRAVELASQPMVVDNQFNSFSTRHLLKDRDQLGKLLQKKPLPAVARQPELPITPNGRLAPGILYESSTTSGLKYYLPEYVLRIVNAQYTTRLNFRSTDDDPHGPIAFLTIEFIAAKPEDHRFNLKEIEHEALVYLIYDVDVNDEPPGDQSPSGAIDDLVGEWRNVDANTRGMTRLLITGKTDTAGTFHGFGKCHPEDCDWGEIPSIFSAGQMTGVYRFGFKDTHITIKRSGENLQATVFNDYAEGDRRSDRTDTYMLRRELPQSPASPDKPTLSMEIGAVEKISQTVRRCRLAIHSKEAYDQLFQIMSDPGHNARLDVRCRATVGYRTWRQIFIGDIFTTTRRNPVTLVDIKPPTLRVLRPVTDGQTPATPTPRRTRPNRPRRGPTTPRRPAPVMPVVTLRRPLSGDGAAPSRIPPSSHLVSDVMRVSEEIHRAPSRPIAHPGLISPTPRKTKVPSRVIVDKGGEPVITRRDVSSTQMIRPFWFNLETHSYMFDIPEIPPTRHILLKRDIFIQDQSLTFFQDSILRRQVYYEPQAFRLSRTAKDPHVPDLLFAFNDVTEEGEDEDVSIDYRVRMAYRVMPYVDQRFFAQARLEFGAETTFSALTPRDSTLMMRLPRDEDESWIPVTRSEAEISLDEGIIDEIELTSAQFQKVFSAFQSPATIGIEGALKVALLDGSDIDIPVEVSLQENTGPLFRNQFAATGDPGQYQLTLTNQIESPVTIHRMDPVTLGPGAIAHPSGLSLPSTVDPGQSVTIVFTVTPSDTPVAGITPLLETTIDTDYERLWPLITVNQGFVSRTFDIQVSIHPQFFSTTPQGQKPLTAVVVEFDSFATVELTPSLTTRIVPLRMPLLPVLLNRIEAAQTYRFRVLNQHADGPGTMSEWRSGSGDLQVQPTGGS